MNIIIFESFDRSWIGTYVEDDLIGVNITIGNCIDILNCTYSGLDQGVSFFGESTMHWTLNSYWMDGNIIRVGSGRLDYIPSEHRWFTNFNTFDTQIFRTGTYHSLDVPSTKLAQIPELSPLMLLLIGFIAIRSIKKCLKYVRY